MKQLARIVADTHGGVPVAQIVGEVDMTNSQAIAERLRALLTNRSVALIVDLGPTTYLDSSGITLLFGLSEELRRRQQQLHVVVPEGSPVARVLGITGLDQVVPTHPTVEDALERAA
jgi:anti-anti-sigma factor